MQPRQLIELQPGEELGTFDQSIKDATVCQWPEGVPLTTKNWNAVFNHFKKHGTFLSAEEVLSLIAPD